MFPVGLSDAVWFVSKNDNVSVVTVPEITDVPKEIFYSTTSWAFKFHPDGNVSRVIMGKNGLKELQM